MNSFITAYWLRAFWVPRTSRQRYMQSLGLVAEGRATAEQQLSLAQKASKVVNSWYLGIRRQEQMALVWKREFTFSALL